MELKDYQKKVMSDLKRFLELLIEKQNITKAYNTLWEEKGVEVGMLGMPYYNSVLNGVPQVCLKVPTGGGKTFLAANSIKPIFDSMPKVHPKAVVWLVPSDTILKQTHKALNDNSHAYRQKINVDFGGRVEIYTKEQLLNGQNFNPSTVQELLSIFVLSYDSFRTNKKEGRKAYQENGYLAPFSKYNSDKGLLLEDTDETALIQVIRQLNPVVIVDESHHATSKLSVEMLGNFNPSFVLDLTATPTKGSNVISFVDARQLKKEQMVKLPVIVYNRKTQNDVFVSAISLRQKLELQAKKLESDGGRYIRPIVLFQAQPRVGEDSTTYEKIKKALVEMGIPEEEIAIKTADVDEIKNQNLMSSDCKIRYIITVNALKEGWDCPFAYILATVANRSSRVDVEQILGRVLRMPYTKSSKHDVLNLSYVITSSDNFHATLDKVVEGLNSAGFSRKDYRVQDYVEPAVQEESTQQINFDDFLKQEETSVQQESRDEEDSYDTESVREQIKDILNTDNLDDAESVVNSHTEEMLQDALKQNNMYWEEAQEAENQPAPEAPQEVVEKMKQFKIKSEFEDEVKELLLPQFMVESGPNIFSESEFELLEKENLQVGFTLVDKDSKIDFATIDIEMAKVDVEDKDDDTSPKAWRMQGFSNLWIKEWFDSQPAEKKLAACKDMICKRLSSINSVNDKELMEYVERIISTMTDEQLTDMQQSPYPYIEKIKNKVTTLLREHAQETFDLWVEQEIIECHPNYRFPATVMPAKTIASIPKSLYVEEESMNDYERKVVWELSEMENIKWWHRNISRRGFCINGAVPAYPDLIVMTTSGKILCIETKGDHLENTESRMKAMTGTQWANMAGRMYRYFLVFETKNPNYTGQYSHDRFIEVVKKL